MRLLFSNGDNHMQIGYMEPVDMKLIPEISSVEVSPPRLTIVPLTRRLISTSKIKLKPNGERLESLVYR